MTAAHDTHDGEAPEDCTRCAALATVAVAGARVIAAAAGADYDTIQDPHTRAHYQVIAVEVMDAMSAALVETGLVPAGAEGPL